MARAAALESWAGAFQGRLVGGERGGGQQDASGSDDDDGRDCGQWATVTHGEPRFRYGNGKGDKVSLINMRSPGDTGPHGMTYVTGRCGAGAVGRQRAVPTAAVGR